LNNYLNAVGTPAAKAADCHKKRVFMKNLIKKEKHNGFTIAFKASAQHFEQRKNQFSFRNVAVVEVSA